jgi:prepilin-type N-terminal cleavage/methylation domain-containing protein/prepilin-type processing-associated H-X9-DG protein
MSTNRTYLECSRGSVKDTYRNLQHRKKNSFTLIELLVVVAIIAVLISILLPALARARDQAKQAVCMTNLKQFAIYYSMYATDFNGTMCPPESTYLYAPNSVDPDTIPYPAMMRNYLGDPKIFASKASNPLPGNGPYTWSIMSGNKHGGTSILQCPSNTITPMYYVWQPHYGMNLFPWLYKRTPYYSYNNPSWLKEDMVRDPSNVMLLMDWFQSQSMAGLYNNGAYNAPLYWGTFHNKSMNFLYFDGHSSLYSANKLKGYISPLEALGSPPWYAQ